MTRKNRNSTIICVYVYFGRSREYTLCRMTFTLQYILFLLRLTLANEFSLCCDVEGLVYFLFQCIA